MDFCEYCNNMYYFKHDEENKIIFYCKNCGSVKDIDDDDEAKQIATNNFDGTNEKYTKYINPNIIYDHTIPHVNNIVCLNKECSKKDSDSNDVAYIKYDNTNIKYIYCCSYCKYFWTSKF
uniref:DNA-directed RNA polymerase II subunit RPB9-like zinc ribbon domain-containing protein n=1 Tax=viral metagenome TaxID=1070528 RepID=A0A6C0CT15_9ZZZZ